MCGCEKNDEYKGDFYSLKEVYESNEITRQDLLSIVYYIYGMISDEYPEDFVPTPKDPEELDDNIKRVIENAYKNELKKQDEKQYSDAIVEAKYYGTYNDYICVGINFGVPGVAYTAVAWKVTIDGISYWQTPTFKVLLYKI